MKTIRIALTGGGSGGHIYPLVAVAEKLELIAIEQKLYMEITYFGPVDVYKPVLEDAGIKTSKIVSGKIRRYGSFSNITDIPKFLIGFLQALAKLLFFMPDVLFSKGGSGAFPVVLAAWFYRIPVVIHESDAQPGLNNLFSARFAKRIAVSFEKALNYFEPKKTALTGTPIRKSMTDNRQDAGLVKEELGFNSDKPLVLFLGGSQGSERINKLLLSVLKDLTKEAQILHQTGFANFSAVEESVKSSALELMQKTQEGIKYLPVPYLDPKEMKMAMTAADLIVSRGGSNTIFEIAAFSKPSVIIPLPESANDHQRINAYEFEKIGATIVIEETNLFPNLFLNQISNLFKNKELLKKMGDAAGGFFKPDASKIIAEEIMKLAK